MTCDCVAVAHVFTELHHSSYSLPPPHPHNLLLALLEVTPLGDKHGEEGCCGADGHKTLSHCHSNSLYTVTQGVTLAMAVNTQHRTPEPHRCHIWTPANKKKRSIVIFLKLTP